MIVLDEQLLGRGLERDFAQWYRGTVQFITDLRPHTLIKDEAIPVLLRRQAQPTFVTINERDFWRQVATDQRYCIVCFVLSDARAREIPLAFEDLHWIDSETQALLNSLVESLPTSRLLLLVNYRPEYQHGWGSKTYYTQLRLDPLPPVSADEFLQALLGDDASLKPLTALLIARTEGNPFFLEESVRTMVGTGVLVGERGAYRLEQALAYLREAEALAEALDDPRRLGRVSDFLSFHCHSMGMYAQAITAAQRALALATISGDGVLQAQANEHLGIAYQAQGDYRRAIACFGQTVAFFDGTRHRERFGNVFLPAVLSRAYLAWCHAELGTFAEGRGFGEEGLQIAEAVAHPGSLVRAYWGLSWLALRQGDLSMALPFLERAVRICQDADLPVLFSRITVALGAAYTLAGRVTEAVPLLTQAMAQAAATERVDVQDLYRLPLGEAQLLAGHLEEAQALAEQALTLARTHQERSNQAYALRLIGDIAARRDPRDGEPAEAHYHQALALAEELGMRPLQAHCRRGLGTLYAKRGQWEQARTEMGAARDLYQTMDMTFWLAQVEAVLAQAEER